MKLKVLGWTYYDDYDFEEGTNGWAATNAVIDDIKEHGYLFSGEDHQEHSCCAPILNDGKIHRFSQRGFGGIMAEAHGYTKRMDYSLFAFGINPDAAVYPTREISCYDDLRSQVCNHLAEKFCVNVCAETFNLAQSGAITLDDLPELRYLDVGDTLILRCNGQKAAFEVSDVNRQKDFTKQQRIALQVEFLRFDDANRRRKAEEIYEKTKTVMEIKLKTIEHTCKTYISFSMKAQEECNFETVEEFERWEERQNYRMEVWNDFEICQKFEEMGAKAQKLCASVTVNENNCYNVNVNEMIRQTIGCFVGKERELAEMIAHYDAEVYLVIVPCIKTGAESPNPVLSLERDVVEFLYKTGIKLDLDYYVL